MPESVDNKKRAHSDLLPFTDKPGGDSRDQIAATESKVSGEVLRVVFASDDGQYTVLRLLDDRQREITLVGPVSGIHEGQDIEARGRWEKHPEHGRQFRVKEFRAILPTSEKGIERYLASGLIHGVGPKLAERIVQHFGIKTLDILENYSARLNEVEGLGKKKIRQIRAGWREHAERRDTFIFLQGLGLSPRRCATIFNEYGASAAEVVRSNPYKLASAIHGIGFLTADRIASELGISKDNPIRLEAGTVHTLEKLADDGHVCFPLDKLIERTAELLEIDLAQAEFGLTRAEKNGTVVIDPGRETGAAARVYHRRFHNAETQLAAFLRRLLAYPASMGADTLNFRGRNYEMLNDDQRQAVQQAFQHHVSIITGGPGVGKTTVVGEIVRAARGAGRKVYLAAPTGRAAKRLGESSGLTAKTIHRMLKWEPQKRGFVHNQDRPLKCDMLIVDEVSMLDVNLANSLFAAVSPETHVVLVGDRDQLPSVGPGAVLHDLISCGRIPSINLTEIYRQGAGSRIVLNAHRINKGQTPDLNQPQSAAKTDFYWIDEEDPERVVDIIKRMACQRIPQKFRFNPRTDIQILAPMNNGICGTLSLNKTLQASLNPSDKTQFRSGDRMFRPHDRVMQIVNNYDKGVFNGELGSLTRIDFKQKTFQVMYDTGTVEYQWNEADQIKHAYAVTVHKSQGSEFPVVIMPILTQHYIMLQRNLVYTGMTRARRLLVCVGTRKALNIAIRNNKPLLRYTRLTERLHG
ncbi:MAG: ATP-dependent RecD-like DNA helicase [Lentisphaeria bacterium]